MARKYNFTIHKTKTMTCGHQQTFSTPVPTEGDVVWCHECDNHSQIPKRSYRYQKRNRMKENPRSNNQYTKGRRLVNDKN